MLTAGTPCNLPYPPPQALCMLPAYPLAFQRAPTTSPTPYLMLGTLCAPHLLYFLCQHHHVYLMQGVLSVQFPTSLPFTPSSLFPQRMGPNAQAGRIPRAQRRSTRHLLWRPGAVDCLWSHLSPLNNQDPPQETSHPPSAMQGCTGKALPPTAGCRGGDMVPLSALHSQGGLGSKWPFPL